LLKGKDMSNTFFAKHLCFFRDRDDEKHDENFFILSNLCNFAFKNLSLARSCIVLLNIQKNDRKTFDRIISLFYKPLNKQGNRIKIWQEEASASGNLETARLEKAFLILRLSVCPFTICIAILRKVDKF